MWRITRDAVADHEADRSWLTPSQRRKKRGVGATSTVVKRVCSGPTDREDVKIGSAGKDHPCTVTRP
jgi:hypothetical protein